jgi:membrane-bound ClpP family serine protease
MMFRRRVVLEAIIVGIGLILVYFLVSHILPSQSLWIQLFWSGAAFHLVCEFTGVNQWYALHFA